MSDAGERLVREIGDAEVGHGEALICWLGQHSYVVRLGGTVIYIDPYLTGSKWRLVAPVIDARDVADADIVTGSHDHTDHIDREALPALASASPGATFVVPKAVARKVSEGTGVPPDRFSPLNAGDKITVKGVTISAVPAAHEFLDIDETTGLYPYLGYVFEGNGVTIYHSGDTCIYEGMHGILREWSIDVAFIPINGRDARRYSSGCIGNMTYQEAADISGALGFGLTIPAHYDMFQGNSIDPELFMDYMKVKHPSSKTTLLEHWRPFLFSKL